VDLHVKEFRRRHAIRVEFVEAGMTGRLPREVETAAYRIVQEALTNVAKHAASSSCRVSLVRLARGLVVVVGDDGVGFDAGGERASREWGLGLVSMRERATQLGGSLVVESAPGRGTRVMVELPVEEAPEIGGTGPEPLERWPAVCRQWSRRPGREPRRTRYEQDTNRVGRRPYARAPGGAQDPRGSAGLDGRRRSQ